MSNGPDAREPEFDVPAVYEIRVRGTIGPEWSEWFGGLSISPESDGVTILLGPVEDQPALHGVLAKICALGLPLVSVIRQSCQSGEGADEVEVFACSRRTHGAVDRYRLRKCGSSCGGVQG